MWLTNKKTGKKFNTDWIKKDADDKDRQIEQNRREADRLNNNYTPLYHGTTYENALAILQSDELRAGVSNETETYGVSTTRNKDSAYDQISLVLDRDALRQNYSVKPIYRESIFGLDLAEERINRTISNVSRYIKELRWNDDSKSNIHLKHLRRQLVENFDNPNYTNTPGKPGDSAYYIKQLAAIANQKGIKMDARLSEAVYYIQQFDNRVFDTERYEQLQKKKLRR